MTVLPLLFSSRQALCSCSSGPPNSAATLLHLNHLAHAARSDLMAPPFFVAPISSSTAPSELLPGFPAEAPSAATLPPHSSGAAVSTPASENISLGWICNGGHLALGSPTPAIPNVVITPLAPMSAQLGHSLLGSAAAAPTSTSPRSHSLRVAQAMLNVQEGEWLMRNKRKSPLTTKLLFRSPLSRMLLSPQLRSPTTRYGRSPLATICSRAVNGFDLNLEPYEDAQVDAQNGSDIGSDLLAHQDDGNVSDTGADLQAQENARRRVAVPNEKRRAIFEALIAKASNGHLKGNVTSRVSAPRWTVNVTWSPTP